MQGTIYFLAVQMIQLSSKGTAKNPAFYVYYQKQLARGKSKPQALILIFRRLINIIYGMLKNKTEYVMLKVQDRMNYGKILGRCKTGFGEDIKQLYEYLNNGKYQSMTYGEIDK